MRLTTLSFVCCAAGLIATCPPSARAGLPILNIEIDYMVLRDANGNILHSHRPTATEVNAVVQMFACHGIVLTILVDDEIPHVNVIPQNPSDPGTIFDFSVTPNSFYLYKAAYFNHSGGGWHYCIFGHQYQLNGSTTGSSGLAERPGDDLVVTLGSFSGSIGTPFDRAGTLAHEFGHNLNLTHCGFNSCSGVGPGPFTLPSIMSYYFQLEGVRNNLVCHGLTQDAANLFKQIDYSEGRLCTLVESALSEPLGTRMVPVDWNCNGVISGTVSADFDLAYSNGGSWCGTSGGIEAFIDYNEWANIQDVTAIANKDLWPVPEVTPCISFDESEAVKAAFDHCPQPAVVSEACIGGDMVFLDPAGLPLPSATGRCPSPYSDLATAAALVPNGSVLYLRNGTYIEAGSGLVISKPMVLTSIGSAFIQTATLKSDTSRSTEP